MNPIYAFCKRTFDIAGATVGLSLLALPMAGCALAVRLSSDGPVILRQTRIGRGGKPFVCYKFRTMKTNAPHCPADALRSPDKYITPLGRILRKCSFDEVTQLFNVLVGDMSLIGPRPLIPEERELHRLRMQNGVYTMRPGLSGLSQIHGRDTLPAPHKALLDKAYADCVSLSLDASILTHTLHCIRH